MRFEKIGLEPRPPLLLPLLPGSFKRIKSQQKKERREIRVGKAMVVDKRPAANSP